MQIIKLSLMLVGVSGIILGVLLRDNILVTLGVGIFLANQLDK